MRAAAATLTLAALVSVTGAGCAGLRSNSAHPLETGRFVEYGDKPRSGAETDEVRRLARAWDDWATANLRTGDVVFRRGSWRVFGGAWDVSKYTAKIADSNFTHAGIVDIDEYGTPYVYDTTIGPGPARTRFSRFILEQGLNFGIKRPKPEYADAVPAAMAYVKRVYDERRPFDPRFSDGEETLYCTELVELAYRKAGVKLSEPVAYCHFPHFGRYPIQNTIAWAASGWSPRHEVLLPGNEDIGLWSSAKFDHVFSAVSPYHEDAVAVLPPVPDTVHVAGYVAVEEDTSDAESTGSYLRAVR